VGHACYRFAIVFEMHARISLPNRNTNEVILSILRGINESPPTFPINFSKTFFRTCQSSVTFPLRSCVDCDSAGDDSRRQRCCAFEIATSNATTCIVLHWL
jgi:hypothetical protein